jgi:hypothetical protein
MTMISTRRKVWIAVLVAVVMGVLAFEFLARPIFTTWLRAHATVRMVQSPPGGKFGVAVFRYPRLGQIPEMFGFGQGYVQLYEIETGRVLQEKVADDLTGVRLFAWGPSSVSIAGFAEWQIPGWYQARN